MLYWYSLSSEYDITQFRNWHWILMPMPKPIRPRPACLEAEARTEAKMLSPKRP